MDGSICDGCKQPQEWCACDDPVQGELMEDMILDAPLLTDLDFNDSGVRTDEASQFEEDFDRDLPELEPEDIPEEVVTDQEADELLEQDEQYIKWINEGGFVDGEDEL